MPDRKQMNLLFLFTDQQRYDTLKVYGSSPKLKTPNLDKLAAQSAVFERAYVSQPVCTPSRATIVTGLHPHSHGLITNNLILKDEVPTIGDLAGKGGYNTAYMGKWHLGNEVIRQHGFGTWVSTEDNYRRHYGKEEYKSVHSDYDRFLRNENYMPDSEEGDFSWFGRDFATRIPAHVSKPAFTAKAADRYIGAHRDKPFALYVNFLDPHPPYFSAFDDMYDPEDIDLPANFNNQPPENAPIKYPRNRFQTEYAGRHFPLKDEKDWRKQIARYWGQVTFMDHYMGEILESLEKHGVADRTIVGFTSDHGDMMGDFGMLGKGVMNDSSARVPLLIKVPGVTDNQPVISEPVGQIDLVPTLLDAMGLPPYPDAQGKSLYPVIRGEQELKDNDVFIEFQLGVSGGVQSKKPKHDILKNLKDPSAREEQERIKARAQELYGKPVAERAIVGGGFKLCLNEAGENELFDMTKDPLELQNLCHDPGQKERIDAMLDRIHRWQAETGDSAKI